MSESTIITRKNGWNNNSGYYNELPGMDKSFQNTPNPCTADEYTAGSVSIPLPYLSLEMVPRWRVIQNGELRRDSDKDKFHIAFEAVPHYTMTSSTDKRLSATNFGAEARLKFASPMYNLKYMQLGSDLQLYGSYDKINSKVSMATEDLAVNSFNVYLNNILGSSLDLSYQYYTNKSIDTGEDGGSALYNDIYGISRYSDWNSRQSFNLSLPVNDVVNGGLTTFEGYLKQDLRDRDNMLLGLSLTSRVRGTEGGGFSVFSEMGGLSTDDFRLNGGFGFDIKLGKKSPWTINTTVYCDNITSEYNRSYGLAAGITGKLWGLPVKANVSVSFYNIQAAQNPIKNELWTSGPQTLTNFFSYDQTGAPTQTTHRIEIETNSFLVSNGQPLELLIGTDNRDTKGKKLDIKGVVMEYTDPTTKEITYYDLVANITLSRIEIYDTSGAANNVKVEEKVFKGNATLDNIDNSGSPAKFTFKVNNPLSGGYKRYKIVIYCTTNTGDLCGIGPDTPGIRLFATVKGKLTRLKK